jgi:hypothetical protein
VVLARRVAIGFLCLLLRVVQLLVVTIAGLALVAAGLVMGVIALAILAFMAAEAKCGGAARPQGCAGASWSGALARPGATQLR